MLQIYVYDDAGNKFELDTYEEQPLKLTLSAEEITGIPQINSAFSKEFRIPATQNNSKVFKWWYEVNTIDFDVTKRVVAEIFVDGQFYKSGHIRINSAFVNEQTSNIDLGIVFFGETRDFASQIGEINLNQLNLTALDHELTMATVQASWAGNLKNGDIRYILADRGYTYSVQGSNYVVDQNGVIALSNYGTATWTKQFGQKAHAISMKQLTPMVRVKAIIDAIFAQTNYTYTTDSFFNDALFAELYTEAISEPIAEIEEEEATVDIRIVRQEFLPLTNTRIEYDLAQLNNGASYSTTNYEYTAPVDGNYIYSIDFQGNDWLDAGVISASYTLQLYKNSGGVITPVNSSTDTLFTSGNIANQISSNVTLVAGDKLYAEFSSTADANNPSITGGAFKITGTPVAMLMASLMKYNVKCIDFLKGILTKFKMIMAPSPNNDFEFVIKPWIDYIGSGQNFDWTEKLDVSKDVVLKPVFFEQSQIVDFTDQPDDDHQNKPFQDEHTRTYGELQFDSGNDLLKNTRKVDTVFAPTPVAIVEGAVLNSEFVIPYFSKLGDELTTHNHIEHIPMVTKPRLLWWNGMSTVATNEKWWWYDGANLGGSRIQESTYPRMTPYSEVFPVTATTLNLNWFRETPLFDTLNIGEGMYERYWNAYIQELYSPLARIFTGYFNIDSQDLYNLSFDDVIFIKNAYFRVLKIYDAPLTETAVVKVDLVKLLDYQVIANDTDPTPGGGGIDDVPIDGGGGANNNPPTFKYLVELCVNPTTPIVVESAVALNNGQAVNLAVAAPAVEQCYVVLSPSPDAVQATVTNIYIDCADCVGPIEGSWGETDTNYGDTDVAWGGAVDTYYVVEDCLTQTNTKFVTSQTILQVGDSVKISGAPNVDVCFEVIGFAVTGNDATVLEIFPDCFSCEQ